MRIPSNNSTCAAHPFPVSGCCPFKECVSKPKPHFLIAIIGEIVGEAENDAKFVVRKLFFQWNRLDG